MALFWFLVNFRFVLESTFSNFIKKEINFRKLEFFHREFEWDGGLLRGGGLPFLGVDSWLAAASNVPPGWTKCFLESLYLHIL